MVDWTPDQIQFIIYIVVGIIIIEGIWLAYLTYMMWKKRAKEKMEKAKPEKEEPVKAEEKKE